MMQNLLTVCFLSSSIAAGASLSFEVDEALGDNGVGSVHTCAPGFDTRAIIQEETTTGFHGRLTLQTCVQVSNCDEGLTVINLGKFGTTVKKVTCCTGNECMKDPPPLLPMNTSLNGKKCPACYTTHGLTCNEEIVQCAGDELYCFEMSGTTGLGEMSETATMKGCTNYATCNKTLRSSGSFDGISAIATSNCTLASGTASFVPECTGFFFQAFTGILLGKLFS